MFRINNNDFKILVKYKEFMFDLDNILENIPRKDYYYKDKIKDESSKILENILKCSYDTKYNKYKVNIKAGISYIDFMLDRLYDKKYINENSVYKISTKLIEINKMVTKWINNYES